MVTQQQLDQARIVIVVFTLEGCPACAEYKPRFLQMAQIVQDRMPIIMADANDPRFADLAQRLNVAAVPATFVLRRPTGIIRIAGAIPNDQIAWLLDLAARQ